MKRASRPLRSLWAAPILLLAAVVPVASEPLAGDGTVAAAASDVETSAKGGGSAHAVIKDAKGDEVGRVKLTQTPHGVILEARFSELPAGVHAFHIHDVGKCEPPGFQSAGPHFNPTEHKHGFAAVAGPHSGDLPNVEGAGSKASPVEVSYFVPDVFLGSGKASLLDENGTSVVVHAKADDYMTDPAGDAGDRIACGVIESGS